MNGWTQLHGAGENPNTITGTGQLKISPAALYELPVMFQMLNALSSFSPTPPSSTAFKHAMANFNVSNGAFRFNSIDLVGDALNLRGRGYAKFNGEIDLDFGFKPLRRPNLIKVLVTETYRGWTGIDVTGTVSTPRVQLRPRMDDSLLNFLNAFNPAAAPQLSIPGLRSSRIPRPRNRGRTSFRFNRFNPFRRK